MKKYYKPTGPNFKENAWEREYVTEFTWHHSTADSGIEYWMLEKIGVFTVSDSDSLYIVTRQEDKYFPALYRNINPIDPSGHHLTEFWFAKNGDRISKVSKNYSIDALMAFDTLEEAKEFIIEQADTGLRYDIEEE